MSVIFGIREDDKIIVAGDKRGTSTHGDFLSDDLNKVTAINDKLCFATAGNASIEFAILNDVEKSGKASSMLVDELVNLIEDFYEKLVKEKSDIILSFPFYCLIAGQGSDGNDYLISGEKHNGEFNSMNVPALLLSPPDMKLHYCNKIFIRNYKFNHSLFVEQTIKEISKISKYVSPTGDKWIYDIKTHKGCLYSF